MRSLRLREGARQGRDTLSAAGQLIRRSPGATVLLGLALALLPAMLRAFLVARANASLLHLWEQWLLGLPGGRTRSLVVMINLTLRQFGQAGLWSTLVDLAKSLLFTPLLLSSLALIYNGYIHATGGARTALAAIKAAGQHVRALIVMALMCMLAEWVVQVAPALVSSLLSLLAGMLAGIPVLGAVCRVLAVVLSVLISLLTDFAVVVIFCYVWICAACEDVPGFGALVRSWQLTRNGMHRTIAALLSLALLRWLTVALLAALWALLLRGLPLAGLLYLFYAVGAAHTVMLGAVTSVLYQRRPLPGGLRPGQFRQGGSDIIEEQGGKLS